MTRPVLARERLDLPVQLDRCWEERGADPFSQFDAGNLGDERRDRIVVLAVNAVTTASSSARSAATSLLTSLVRSVMVMVFSSVLLDYVNRMAGLYTGVNYDRVVDKLDPSELLDAAEVAALLGLAHRNAVSVYRHRYSDFPEPLIEKSRCVLWRRSDVEAWAAGRG